MSERKYWQQAAGDNDRDYADICLKWDVVLNGPGYAGKWPQCVQKLKNDGRSSRKMTDLRRFSKDMKDGDIVVLRSGTAKVRGVGVIIGNYEWKELFSDVDGWNLQHVRRVKWLWKGLEKFKTYTLKQGDTTQELDSDEVLQWIESLNLDFKSKHVPIDLPEEKDYRIQFNAVSEYLFDQGISSNSIEILSKEIDELTRIAKWYQRSDDSPSEFETVAYLAVPLLRALGWTPQKMAIEWNNVDVALFSQLPRSDEGLSVIVEAKKKDNSCLTAFLQAKTYADGKENCQRLIVTDGLRYGVYLKREELFVLYAYFNITELKSAYPIYECYGVKEALKVMAPEWVPEK